MESPLPAAAAVSKLMGSDNFVGGGVDVKVKEVKTRESDHASAGPSIDRRISFLSRKDEGDAISALESASLNKRPDAEFCRHTEQQPSSLHGENLFKNPKYQPSMVHGPEAKQLQRKSGKVARSINGCSKRSRAMQIEVSTNENGADDLKEKNHMAKQKNHLNGKRGDKRNGKVPMKSKYDSFSLKAGLLSFNSSAGANSMIGLSGSKPDINDVINHVGELSLNELLDGSYKCPSFAKDKGKKAANSNGTLINSVKKACSILRLQKPPIICTQNLSEVDSNYDLKVSTSLASSGSCVETSKRDGDEGDACTMEQSLHNKSQDPCSKLETTSVISVLDFPLYSPEDILARLSLPPPKDLDSLLLDTAKPILSSRNNNNAADLLRLGKPVSSSQRTGLPPFAWSNASGAHCKSNSDTVKLSTSRSTCQGRWVKIENAGTTSIGEPTNFLVDLESLTYNQSLVPSVNFTSGLSETENVPSTSTSFPNREQGISSSTKCSLASQVSVEAGGSSMSQRNAAGHSPRLLAAAQTLYDMATSSWKQNQHGMTKWPKRPSQKGMKARKVKSNEKPEGNVSAATAAQQSLTGVNKQEEVRNSSKETAPPLKKARVSGGNEKSMNNRMMMSYNSSSGSMSKGGGALTWSTPRSSRSSPNKSFRSLIAEAKQYSADTVKQQQQQACTIMPPPQRIVDGGGSNRQQKVRKVMAMDWNSSRAAGAANKVD